MANEPLGEARRRVVEPGERQTIALEIRSRRLGFAVFRGTTLTDWGTSGYAAGKQGEEEAARKASTLVNLHAPDGVIARQVRMVRDVWSGQAARALRSVKAELDRRSVPMNITAHRDTKRFFSKMGIRTKYKVAQAVAAQFPDLRWRLPVPRKSWDREPHTMMIFDAVATFVAWNGSFGPLDTVAQQAL